MDANEYHSLLTEIDALKLKLFELENKKINISNSTSDDAKKIAFSVELKPAQKNLFRVKKDSVGEYIYVYNEGFTPFLKYENPNDVIGKRISEVFISEVLDQKILLQYDKAFNGEVVSYTISNENWAYQIYLTPLIIDNKVEEIVGTRIDISEQKKYRLALEDSERNFRVLFESAPFPFCVSSLETSFFLTANKSAYDFYELDYDVDISKLSLFDFFANPDEAKKLSNEFRAKNEIYNRPLQIKTNNGKIKWISFSVVKINYKNIDAILHSQFDISQNIEYHERISFESQINKELSELYEPITSLKNLDDIASIVLEKVKKLTNSKDGYIAIIDENTGELVSPTLKEYFSRFKALGDIQRIEKLLKDTFRKNDQGYYSGLWGKSLNQKKSFYSNTPQQEINLKALPHGHISFNSFISTPIIVNDILVGQISLANKENGYSDGDIQIIERFAEYFGLALQQNKAFEKIKSSEVNLTALINNTKDFIWAIDKNYKLIVANQNFIDNYNKFFNEDLNLNDNILDTGPDTLSFWRVLYKKAFNGVSVSEEQVYVINNIEYYYEISLHPIVADNEIIGATAFSRDITDRKLAERALKQSEEKYRFMTENITDVLWQIDKEFNFLYISPAVYTLFGYEREELIGHNLLEILSSDFEEEIKSIVHNRISNVNNLSHVYELQIKHKNKKFIWCEILVNPIFDENNNLIKFQGLTRNIEDRKKAEQQLKKYAQDLKELNSAKDKFFSIIAHDLKNPIATLLNTSDVLAKPELDLSRQEMLEYARDLNNATKQLHNLLDNLLTWSRSQTNQIRFEPTQIDLSEVGTMNYYLLMMQAEAKNIKLTTKIKSNIFAYADFNMINTVVRNLTSNAIKFTPEFGEVIIEAIYNSKDKVEISVSDNGVGLSEKDAEKLFRIDVSHTTIGSDGEKGTGLGLILCKEFVEKNNGEIWVESKLGKGSKFIFTIPKAKETKELKN